MKKLPLWLILMLLLVTACLSGTAKKTPAEVVTKASTIEPSAVPLPVTTTQVDVPSEYISDPIDGERIWAAEAFSETAPTHSLAAIGPADGTGCGNTDGYWYADQEEEMDEHVLILTYYADIIPQTIRVYYQGDPTAITIIEAIHPFTGLSVIQEVPGIQEKASECPQILDIPVPADFAVNTIFLHVNGMARVYIDAVELIGSPPGPKEAELPIYWRMGGRSDDPNGLFGIPMLMDLDSYGNLYIADGRDGVVVLDVEGNLVRKFKPEGAEQIVDVKLTPTGNLVLADRGTQQITVTTTDGEEIIRFGEIGTDPGQFGSNSPRVIAVDPAYDIVYVLDDNKDELSNPITRLLTFNLTTGEYLEMMDLPELQPGSVFSMECDSYSMLNIPLPDQDYILRVDPLNREVSKIGEEGLENSAPRVISMTPQGDMYVGLTWSEDGSAIRFLDALGNEFNRLGVLTHQIDPDEGWHGGEFFNPQGIAVDPMGMYLFVSDSSGEFSYVTAYLLFPMEQ